MSSRKKDVLCAVEECEVLVEPPLAICHDHRLKLHDLRELLAQANQDPKREVQSVEDLVNWHYEQGEKRGAEKAEALALQELRALAGRLFASGRDDQEAQAVRRAADQLHRILEQRKKA